MSKYIDDDELNEILEKGNVQANLKTDIINLLDKYMVFEKALDDIDDFYKELIKMIYPILNKDLKAKYKVLIEK